MYIYVYMLSRSLHQTAAWRPDGDTGVVEPSPSSGTSCQPRKRAFLEDRDKTMLQGYLAHKETPTPLRPPSDPRHSPTVGS